MRKYGYKTNYRGRSRKREWNSFEYDINLGNVGYDLHIFYQLGNLTKFNLSPKKRLLKTGVEVQGHIYLGDINNISGKILTLFLEDGRYLDMKLDFMGTIIESSGFYEILE